MNKILYLVSYIGIYQGYEGDHSHWLFDNEADAIKCFFEQKENCLSYYRDELGWSFRTFYDDSNMEFQLIADNDDENEHVDIYITEITADGKVSQSVL